MAETPADSASDHKIDHHSSVLALLQQACEWINISQGRAKTYQKLIREFWNGSPHQREHILVHNEAYEIVDIYKSWHQKVDLFPGLKPKIAESFQSGPILREDEITATSGNRARNDAFVYYLAGQLLDAGVDLIAVEGCVRSGETCHDSGDITVRHQSLVIDFQCKRPQTLIAAQSRLKEARRQIERAPVSVGGGVIGIDCSAFLRPPGTLLEKSSSSEAASTYQREMQNKLFRLASDVFRPKVLGACLFARGPSMIITHDYGVLTRLGRPYREVRPESVCVSTVINNLASIAPDVVPSIFALLKSNISG